jgi:amidase
MKADDYLSHDALGLAALIRRREVSAREVIEACLARIEAVNPKINAVIHLDAAPVLDAIADAAPSDAPLFGVPYFIKDLHAPVKDLPLAHGSRAFAGSVFDFDSETVARLRRAGLHILGRTNAPELGMTATTEPKLHGPTRNPWALDRSAGGSSGGAAAAVAAGILPATHATDSAGSIRIPASACGVFGLKPTRGLLPSGPHRGDPNHGLSHEHAATRTVRDSAALLDATAGPDIGAPYFTQPPPVPYLKAIETPPRKLRIALTTRSFYNGARAHRDVAEGVEATGRLLAFLGHEVEEAAPAFDGRALLDAMITVLYAGLAGLIEMREKQLGRALELDELEPATWAAVEWGRGISGARYAQQFGAINHAVRAIGRFFTRYDLLVTPVLARPTARLGELSSDETDIGAFNDTLFRYAPFAYPFNATGQPAASLPLAWMPDNMPVGIQCVARFGQDATLLQLAQQLEDATKWPTRRAVL